MGQQAFPSALAGIRETTGTRTGTVRFSDDRRTGSDDMDLDTIVTLHREARESGATDKEIEGRRFALATMRAQPFATQKLGDKRRYQPSSADEQLALDEDAHAFEWLATEFVAFVSRVAERVSDTEGQPLRGVLLDPSLGVPMADGKLKKGEVGSDDAVPSEDEDDNGDDDDGDDGDGDGDGDDGTENDDEGDKDSDRDTTLEEEDDEEEGAEGEEGAGKGESAEMDMDTLSGTALSTGIGNWNDTTRGGDSDAHVVTLLYSTFSSIFAGTMDMLKTRRMRDSVKKDAAQLDLTGAYAHASALAMMYARVRYELVRDAPDSPTKASMQAERYSLWLKLKWGGSALTDVIADFAPRCALGKSKLQATSEFFLMESLWMVFTKMLDSLSLKRRRGSSLEKATRDISRVLMQGQIDNNSTLQRYAQTGFLGKHGKFLGYIAVVGATVALMAIPGIREIALTGFVVGVAGTVAYKTYKHFKNRHQNVASVISAKAKAPLLDGVKQLADDVASTNLFKQMMLEDDGGLVSTALKYEVLVVEKPLWFMGGSVNDDDRRPLAIVGEGARASIVTVAAVFVTVATASLS
jgi:hypothetical protein